MYYDMVEKKNVEQRTSTQLNEILVISCPYELYIFNIIYYTGTTYVPT